MILMLVVFGLGVMIGFNYSWNRLKANELKTFEEVDAEVRRRLYVAENLNKSLLSDVEFLKNKIKRLENIKGKNG